jgi:(2Fe-2S) ferredoxin
MLVNRYTSNDTTLSRKVVYCDELGIILICWISACPVRVPRPEETISKKKAKRARKERANGALATLSSTKSGAKVRDYDAHVLLCNGGDCKKRGSKDVRRTLKNELRERGMARDVRIDSVDCLGLCKHGPNVVVYPARTWYLGLGPGDVPEVVERHLGGGEPVEHLTAGFRPRKKKK